ncbi:hypothetical protein J7E20_08345 [Bacillus sp. ISL-26]|uniref:YopX family protein n=1 Tax=Bacillus sp. ISL-26 TaxID=2819119 RepID=UPI001BE91C50|nr:YopX family protein [Bacillus sp. ISL-26]MBT2634571.1 hypothetical protein [Bacillus sp. ISL-26]
MREIKFRAWDKKHKHFFDVKEFGKDGSNCWASSKTGGFRHWNPIFFQHTGLKDKNDREIYFDNSFVKLTVLAGAVKPYVEMQTGELVDGVEPTHYEYMGVITQDKLGNPKIGDFYLVNLLEADKYEFEVIGIYEDPELLETAE